MVQTPPCRHNATPSLYDPHPTTSAGFNLIKKGQWSFGFTYFFFFLILFFKGQVREMKMEMEMEMQVGTEH